MSGLRKIDGDVACAARINARFVTDLEPGITTRALTGFDPRKGADHNASWVLCELSFCESDIYISLPITCISMCGRYAQSLNTSELAEEFGIGVTTPAEELPSTWNIAPTNPIYIVRASQTIAEQRELSIASWGIMAHWHQSEAEARASQSHAINARSESIHEKPTFRNAFRTQRCLVPADGYYEWATALGKYSPKQPFYISSSKTRSLPIAGIWSTWKSMEGEIIQSAAIITREAVGELATIHSRMPVMMPRDRWDAWLDPSQHDVELLISLMNNPQPDDGLVARPVSSEVNLVRNNSPRLIEPITLGEPETLF